MRYFRTVAKSSEELLGGGPGSQIKYFAEFPIRPLQEGRQRITAAFINR
jgi:hypothetical protein